LTKFAADDVVAVIFDHFRSVYGLYWFPSRYFCESSTAERYTVFLLSSLPFLPQIMPLVPYQDSE